MKNKIIFGISLLCMSLGTAIFAASLDLIAFGLMMFGILFMVSAMNGLSLHLRLDDIKEKITNLSTERNSLSAQNDTIKEMYETALIDLCQAKSDAELIRQKYSRTNQPRSGGRFVKGENFISKVGDRFECNRDFIMNEGWVAFTSGMTYLCEADGCLTDNQGYYMHGMGEDNIKLYFTRVRQ